MDEKFSVTNEFELAISGVITRPEKAGRLPAVVLAPSLLETMDSPRVKQLAKFFVDHAFAVVRFDFTNGLGKSEGYVEHALVSQRARDLELVINHIKRRAYINDSKVFVIGNGFGAMATLALEGFANMTRGITLVDVPSAIDDTTLTRYSERDMLRIKLKRYFHLQHDGHEIRINYTFFEDGYRLDMFRCARNLRTPVLYLTGGDSAFAHPMHAERLHERTVSKRDIMHAPTLDTSSDKVWATFVGEQSLAFFKKNKLL
jgi:pimeloyl-ACP methyl ester carboxylesterase